MLKIGITENVLKNARRHRQSLAAANDVCGLRVQPVFCRRCHHARRPPLAKIRPGRPAPTTGPGTTLGVMLPVRKLAVPLLPPQPFNGWQETAPLMKLPP